MSTDPKSTRSDQPNATTPPVEDEGRISLVEEVLHLGKQEVTIGNVRVHTVVDSHTRRSELRSRSAAIRKRAVAFADGVVTMTAPSATNWAFSAILLR